MKNLPGMVILLKRQTSAEQISRIIFYSVNPPRNKEWIPYFEALKNACRESKVELRIRITGASTAKSNLSGNSI